MKRALLVLARGFEEIEAITVIDILRRAEIEVVVAGLEPGPLSAARQTRHLPDCLLTEIEPTQFDLLILPGGQPGTNHLRRHARLREIVRQFHDNQRWIAAICAAPTVLADLGLLTGRAVTCHPTVREEVAPTAGRVSDDRVVVDGHIVTSQAAGTAMEFAFKLVELLCGPEKAAQVNQGVRARL